MNLDDLLAEVSRSGGILAVGGRQTSLPGAQAGPGARVT